MQSKKLFEIILHVGRVTSLQSWMAKRSCDGQILTKEYSIFDYPSNFEVINKNSLSAFNYLDYFSNLKVRNILGRHDLETLISELVLKRAFRKCILPPLLLGFLN